MTISFKLNLFLFFFSGLLLTSCYVEESISDLDSKAPSEKSYPDVDRRLWPYFTSFEAAALEHGIRIDLVALKITGVIENIPDSGVAGTCQFGSHIHHVTIDQQYWNRASDLRKEFVIYHELGHCVLARGHRETENGDGLCLSIMNSGTTDCFVAYNEVNKSYYLGELFDFEE